MVAAPRDHSTSGRTTQVNSDKCSLVTGEEMVKGLIAHVIIIFNFSGDNTST